MPKFSFSGYIGAKGYEVFIFVDAGRNPVVGTIIETWALRRYIRTHCPQNLLPNEY